METMVMLSVEDLRNIIREEVEAAVKFVEQKRDLPHFLTREEMANLLQISQSKSYELIGRPDFPVCREFGIKIYTDKLFEWIEANMQNAPAKNSRIRSIS